MQSITQQLIEVLATLSDEDQQSVLEFAIALKSQSTKSFVEAAAEYIGRGEGLSDLSTNPDYMKDYGESTIAPWN